MKAQIGDKVLVTTDNFFIAPDGKQYRAVFGTLHSIDTAEDTLGIRPNGRSSNWYMQVGRLSLAGCQVHYVLRTDEVHSGPVTETPLGGEVWSEQERGSQIYLAD